MSRSFPDLLRRRPVHAFGPTALLVAWVALGGCAPRPAAGPRAGQSPSAAIRSSPLGSAVPAGSPPTGGPAQGPSAQPSLSPAPPSDPFALALSTRFPTPEALAAALTRAETAIRAGTATGAELTSLGQAQDAAYRQLLAQPEWRPAVLAQLPANLRPVAGANLSAGDDLKAISNPRDDLPPWRILAPRPEPELLAAYQEAQASSGVPWPYLAAVNLVETRMGRIQGLSTSGAVGPMQFMPATWAFYGRGDINNPHDAILGAARLLAAHGAPGDMASALLAYNHSPHYVRAVTAYAQQIQANPRALDGYYAWRVYFRTATRGEALLVEGYGA